MEIDETVLRETMALTGEKNKSSALAKAVTEFVRRRRAREFGQLIREGAFDYPDPRETSQEDVDPGNPVPPLETGR